MTPSAHNIALSIVLLSAFGCRGQETPNATAVATIKPIAAIVEPIIGSDVHVLLSPGASPHTYDPKPSDVRTAASASILFFGSRDLDGWAAGLDVDTQIALLDFVPDSLLLGGEGPADHPDPHFWMDPLAVRSILPALADTLCVRFPARCSEHRRRASEFSVELAALDDSLTTILEDAQGASVLASHPFLGYFARRYGLTVAGVIEEIPGSEPTPRDMMRLVEQAKSMQADVILTLPQHPSRAAEAVSESTGIPILELDPIGGGSNGYQDLLYFNALKIRSALAKSIPEP